MTKSLALAVLVVLVALVVFLVSQAPPSESNAPLNLSTTTADEVHARAAASLSKPNAAPTLEVPGPDLQQSHTLLRTAVGDTTATGQLINAQGEVYAEREFVAQLALRITPKYSRPTGRVVHLGKHNAYTRFITDKAGYFNLPGRLSPLDLTDRDVQFNVAEIAKGKATIEAILRIGINSQKLDSGQGYVVSLQDTDPDQIDFGQISLPKPDTCLSGRVLDQTGLPVVGAEIRLITPGTETGEELSTYTNSTGHFSITEFSSAHQFLVRATSPKHFSLEAGPFARGRAGVSLVMEGFGSITAHLIKDERLPYENWVGLVLPAGQIPPLMYNKQQDRSGPWGTDSYQQITWKKLLYGIYDLHLYNTYYGGRVRTLTGLNVNDGPCSDPRLLELNPLFGVDVSTLRIHGPNRTPIDSVTLECRSSGTPDSKWASIVTADLSEWPMPVFDPPLDLNFRADGFKSKQAKSVRYDVDLELEGGIPARLALDNYDDFAPILGDYNLYAKTEVIQDPGQIPLAQKAKVHLDWREWGNLTELGDTPTAIPSEVGGTYRVTLFLGTKTHQRSNKYRKFHSGSIVTVIIKVTEPDQVFRVKVDQAKLAGMLRTMTEKD